MTAATAVAAITTAVTSEEIAVMTSGDTRS